MLDELGAEDCAGVAQAEAQLMAQARIGRGEDAREATGSERVDQLDELHAEKELTGREMLHGEHLMAIVPPGNIWLDEWRALQLVAERRPGMRSDVERVEEVAVVAL